MILLKKELTEVTNLLEQLNPERLVVASKFISFLVSEQEMEELSKEIGLTRKNEGNVLRLADKGQRG